MQAGREIKFRAWDEENKRMLLASCVDLLIDLEGRLNSHDLGALNGYANTPQHTLLQYTGLKDKNGKEIYEGDIIKVNDLIFESSSPLPEKLNVVYCMGMFQLFRGKEPLFGLHLMYIKDGEVIGNIYENPEMLSA